MSKKEYCVRVREVIYSDYYIYADNEKAAVEWYKVGALDPEALEGEVVKVTEVKTNEVVYER